MTTDHPDLVAGVGPDDPIPATGDPFALLETWLALAERHEVNDPNAMALSTVDADGLPNVRMVLLKSTGPDGLVFYTNTLSRKGRELTANPRCAAVLYWKSLRRQVRVRGSVARVTDAEADAYFGSRSRGSRIGAWVSRQSEPLADRAGLESAFVRKQTEFGDGDIPRPPHWTGFRISPLSVEFWKDGRFRLHDRVAFSRPEPSAPWTAQRLHP